jgi:adenosylcobinamide-GDP ribazoletransferase
VRAALGLLTRLPVGTVADDPGAAAFAVVGAAVGLVGAVPLVLFGLAGEPVLGAIAGVATIALVSGGLHLDGLADTADALLATTPAAAERAREDPAVGPGGVAAILIVLGSQVAALASVTASSGSIAAAAIIVVGGSVSRWLPVAAVVLLRHRIGPDGLGAWFAARVSVADVVMGGVSVVVVTGVAAVVAGPVIAIAAVVGVVASLLGAALLARARARLDGDGLGACVEIALTATVVALAVIAR